MAVQQSTTEGALFRALRSVDVDPTLAFDASEETRRQAGQNIIEILGAKIDAQSAEIKADIKALNSRIDAQGTEIKALGKRLDTLGRVIWPLIALLAVPIIGHFFRG